MTRSRRSSRAAPASIASTAAPPATFGDAAVVVAITDAGVAAIRAAAAEHGLNGPPWDPDVLHQQIADIIAHALRRSTEWWAGRTGQEVPRPHAPQVRNE